MFCSFFLEKAERSLWQTQSECIKYVRLVEDVLVKDARFVFRQRHFRTSLLSHLIQLALIKEGDKSLSIEQQRQSDGSEEYILRPTQTFAMLKKIDSSGSIGKHFRYENNPFQLTNEPFLANVNHFEKESQCLYLQPNSHVAAMQKLIEELE